jgi:hypothetical protein
MMRQVLRERSDILFHVNFDHHLLAMVKRVHSVLKPQHASIRGHARLSRYTSLLVRRTNPVLRLFPVNGFCEELGSTFPSRYAD